MAGINWTWSGHVELIEARLIKEKNDNKLEESTKEKNDNKLNEDSNNTDDTYVWKEHIESIQKNPYKLQNVPDFLRVKELCMIAVSQEGCTIQYVPDDIIDQNMCDVALNNNNFPLPYIPIRFLTANICFKILKKEWSWAVSIPFIKMSKELQNELLNLILDYNVSMEPSSFSKKIKCLQRNKVDCLNFLLREIGNIDYLNEDVLIKLIQQNIYMLNKLGQDYLHSLNIKKIFEGNIECYKMNGVVFNKLFNKINFSLLTNDKESHNGYLIKDGFNLINQKSNNLFFTTSRLIGNFFYKDASLIYERKVKIPIDAKIIIRANYKFETDKIILSKKENINKEFLNFLKT